MASSVVRFVIGSLVPLAHLIHGADVCEVAESCQGNEGQEGSTNLLQTKLSVEADSLQDRLLRSTTLQDNVCRPPTEDTFARLMLQGSDSSTDLIVDLTSALKDGSTFVLITAMSKNGLYVDGHGFATAYASPLEMVEHAVLELRLSKDGESVDVYRPVWDLRTSDVQSELALAKGVGDGWLDSLPRLYCSRSKSGDRQIIVDGNIFLDNAFYIIDTNYLGSPQRVRGMKEFKKNFDVDVDYAFEPSFRAGHAGQPVIKVGFSVIQLPKTPMAVRGNDDRLLFFDTMYTDKGYRTDQKPWKKPSDTVDNQASVIWRHNLPALPNGILIYIDPSVPERWRSYFKQGIENWNDAFELVGRANAVRGVLPTDPDWPKDYNIADARFNTISWDFTPSTTSMGIAKVDPRSGEIIKSDIIMADTWVSAYLSELELETVNFTHVALKTLGKLEDSSESWWQRGAPKARLGEKSSLLQNHARHDEMKHRQAKSFGFAAVLLSNPASEEKIAELMGAGLADVVMHEVGHILGLRHNFKGTLAISRECLKDKACTAKNSVTASVMDYVPLNMPGKDGKEVDLFAPTVGAWDKLAIRFGYADFELESNDAKLKDELKSILEEAGRYETCYDFDQAMDDDPSCLAYDLSSDPIGYFEEMLERYSVVLSNLLGVSVTPGDSYILYGKAVVSLLSLVLNTGSDAILYLGGVNNSYLHRTEASTRQAARKPIDVSMQRHALEIVKRLFRPEESGLWPAAGTEQYMVKGSSAGGAIESLDITYILQSFTGQVISGVLSASRLEQVFKQEKLMGAATDEDKVLHLEEYLETIVQSLTREGFDAASSSEEKSLQRQLVQALVECKKTAASDSASPDVVLQIEYQLRYIGSMAKAALGRLQLANEALESSAGKSMTSRSPALMQQIHVELLLQDIEDEVAVTLRSSAVSYGVSMSLALAVSAFIGTYPL